MQYWLCVLRKENFDINASKNFSCIGFSKRFLKSAMEINIGDKVVIYVASKISKIAGIVEINSDYYESYDWVWDDVFPIRLKTKPFIILENDKFIDIRILINKLSFIRNKKAWRYYFRHSLKKIDFKDYKLIEQYLLKRRLSLPSKKY